MAVVLVEGDDKLPGLVGNSTIEASVGQTRRTGYWVIVVAMTVACVVI